MQHLKWQQYMTQIYVINLGKLWNLDFNLDFQLTPISAYFHNLASLPHSKKYFLQASELKSVCLLSPFISAGSVEV